MKTPRYFDLIPAEAKEKLSPVAYLLLGVLVEHQRRRKPWSELSNEALGEKLSRHPDRIRIYFAEIEREGFIRREVVGGRRRGIELFPARKGAEAPAEKGKSAYQVGAEKAPSAYLVGASAYQGGASAYQGGASAGVPDPKCNDDGDLRKAPYKVALRIPESVAFAGAPAREGGDVAEPTQRESSTPSEPEPETKTEPTPRREAPAAAAVETPARREAAVRAAWDRLPDDERAERLATARAESPSLTRLQPRFALAAALDRFERDNPDLFPPLPLTTFPAPPKAASRPVEKPARESPRESLIRGVNALGELPDASELNRLAELCVEVFKDPQSHGYYRRRLDDVARKRVKPALFTAAAKFALGPNGNRPGAIFVTAWDDLKPRYALNPSPQPQREGR